MKRSDSNVLMRYMFSVQGDHSPDTLKFPDIALTMRGTHAHVSMPVLLVN